MTREIVEAEGGQSSIKNGCARGSLYALIDQINSFLGVDLNFVRAVRLPMGRKDYDGRWLDFRGDLLANLLELRVDRMVDIVHDVGLWRSVNIALNGGSFHETGSSASLLTYSAMRDEVYRSSRHCRILYLCRTCLRNVRRFRREICDKI